MHIRTWLRIGLVAVVLAAVGAIAWSLISRSRTSTPLARESLLPADITRRSTEFEYLQREQGKIIFKVQAATSVMNQEGEHTLKEVTLVHYDSEGTATDAVEGREATYHVFQKQVEFRDNVTIHLADGTNISSSRVSIDLNAETVRIDQAFRFRLGEAGGEGEGLQYEIPGKRLQISGGLQMEAPAGGNQIRVRAAGALYLPENGRLELRENSSIMGSEHRLSAAQIDIILNPDRRIQRIESRGDAELVAREGRLFRGNSIHFYFQPERRRLDYFEVLGGSSGQALAFRPALYEERLIGGVHRLEAGRIRATVSEGSANSVRLQQMQAHGSVSLRSSVLGIEDTHAESLRIQFFAETEGFERLVLEQKVSLLRQFEADSPTAQERLHGDFVEVALTPLQLLESATVRGNVTVESNMDGEFRSLSAKELVDLEYQEGLLQKVSAFGDCLLEVNRAEQRNYLRAPRLEARFERGLIKKLNAFGVVELELQQTRTSSLHTRSRQLEALFHEGVLQQLFQSGDFHLRDRSADAVTSLTAERGIYDARSMRLTATGRQNPVLQYSSVGPETVASEESETVAEQIVLDRARNLILGRGNVRSVVQQKTGPVVVTAGEMKADLESGWIEYQQSPRLVQADNLVTGNWIRLNNQKEELRVEGEVKSFVVQEQSGAIVRYDVRSDELLFRREEKQARYQGNVLLKTGDVQIEAPTVDVHFSSELFSEVTQVVASGGVLILDNDRKARGRQAIYIPAEERYKVTN